MKNTSINSRLTAFQVKSMIAIGIVGWFLAAMVVRIGGPIGLFNGLFRVGLYVGLIVLWYPIYQLIKAKLKLSKNQVVPAISIGTSAAALCDGIAMPWASFIYGDSAQTAFYGAAWILWFVGIGLMMAYVDSMSES